MSVLKRMQQHFCKHKFKKHYNTTQGRYEYRCVKCNKLIV